jgi:signal transduction histidine kinase
VKRTEPPHPYQGGYLIGFILIAVVALRAVIFYGDRSNLLPVFLLLATYALLYGFEPGLSKRFGWHKIIYFPLQVAIVLILSAQRPFLDFYTVLYFPLSIQIFRTFSRPAATVWTMLFVILLAIVLIPGLGLWEALALILLNLASGAFMISYDFLYLRTQVDQAESQRMLAALQAAHLKLKGYTDQAEELAASRERNRLARELHDSVSQVIFSITLTSQSARLLLERDPARLPHEIERLQEMTSNALSQLRSLIAELRPR